MRDDHDKHPLARMLVIGLVASLVGIAIALAIDWFPTGATTKSHEIDTLYDVLLIVSVPVFVLVMTVALYSVYKFRARPGDMGDGAPIHGNTRLEVVWVAVPTIIVSVLAAYAWIVLNDVEAKQKNEMHVRVIAQQFAWHFQYLDEQGKPTTNTLYLPKDRPVKFDVVTRDVLHSFWVPSFRLKTDTVPGLTTHIRVTPNRLGNYDIVCAELCGLGHSTMRQTAHVVPKAGFDAWIAKQKAGPSGGGPAPGATASASPTIPAHAG
ncbi:MAG: cytochrome c oxidase subunit [Thermoleophilaceae bacterium]|nr:cytochrome c oxidase subunit [Thermoleophilaceae bacterium]